MAKRPLESLGVALRERRGSRKLRETAKEIGISPATLMRVENGRVPDLVTFGKMCSWLELDPGDFLGSARPDPGRGHQPAGLLAMTAHFRADSALDPNTINALAQMLLLAARWKVRPEAALTDDDA